MGESASFVNKKSKLENQESRGFLTIKAEPFFYNMKGLFGTTEDVFLVLSKS